MLQLGLLRLQIEEDFQKQGIYLIAICDFVSLCWLKNMLMWGAILGQSHGMLSL
jgi:hypothetical protein